MVEETSAENRLPAPGKIGLPDARPVDADGALPFHTVVIGASAGGVEAVMRLFGGMPVDSGCAFIVVMHLSAERESMMAALIGRTTRMPVEQATHDRALEPDSVFIAPPGQYLEVQRGRLLLRPIGPRVSKPVNVDHCMVSLAADQRSRAIGIVLTGLDSDGTLGIKAIKGEGGLTVAQLPSEAAHPDMPRSALATGQVDWELAIEDMAQAISGYVAIGGDVSTHAPSPAEGGDETLALRDILDVVRAQLGLDFRGYKPQMLLRRVARRMGLTRIGNLHEFTARLQADATETRALADDFLISVTEFFREPEAWSALAEDVLPVLLKDKRVGDSVRVWVPACATGEEAYSVAMTLLDDATLKERGLKLQVFATDIDEHGLDVARRGHYALAIENTVNSGCLQRFFAKTASGYQVRKHLREAVMFAAQDVVNDPPFSRMDVVSCRNLLIYMGQELQTRMLQVFHFALEPGGVLALGKSETIGGQAALFAPATSRAHLYRRIGAARSLPIAAAPQPVWRRGEPARAAAAGHASTDYGRMMRDALLNQRVAAAVVTDRHGHALYFYGPVHTYLQQPEGAPTTDLFSMVRDELRPQLRAALHKSHSARDTVETLASMHVAEQGEQVVRLVVAPLDADPTAELLLVTFERVERERPQTGDAPADADALRVLEDELRTTKRELRAAIEQLESANEELKVANEEAMSMNEELQSANEELETSKEELQSVNEELTTVNHQLEEKVSELEVVNNDLGNLLTSTHIPTLFLDRALRIKRFTPAATRLFPLLPGDLDRPLSDIAGPHDLSSLLDDARRVLATLAPVERETRSGDGASFLRRTLPYRTQEDRIEGVVVTFADITELKRAGEDMRRHAAVMLMSNDAIIVHDLGGRVLAWNRGAEALYGYSEEDMLGSDVATLLPTRERARHAQLIDRLKAGERVQSIEGCRRRRDGTTIDVSVSSSLVVDDQGLASAVALTERDITTQKRAEAELRESEERFRTLADSAPALIWMADANGALEFVNQEFARTTGLGRDQLLGRWWVDLLHRDDADGVTAALARLVESGRPSATGRIVTTARLFVRGGEHRWMKIALMQRSGAERPSGKPASEPSAGLVGTMVDIDAQVAAEQELRDAGKHKDEFLAMLGHELRNPLVPIRNAAEILSRIANDDGRLRWVRDTLVRQVDHVTRLVDDLLDISLVARNAMRLHLEPVELVHALSRALEIAAPLMDRKRHVLVPRLPSHPVWVEGDAIRLAQVFENLLANAAKYTDEEGRVEVELRAQDGRAIVEVRDNGLGIEPALAGRIFELFVQDQRSIDRSQGGLGIGLALVRRLVEMQGGTVEAFSEGVNRGSRFVMTLPLLATAPLPVVIDVPVAGMRTGRVMIVDDDVVGAESLVMLLELGGYDVRFAGTMAAALETARTFRPQVVVLDIAMPDADGYEVAERLRALAEMDGDVTYVALSGFGRPEDFARSADARFARHLVKPVDPRVLEELLQGALGR